MSKSVVKTYFFYFLLFLSLLILVHLPKNLIEEVRSLAISFASIFWMKKELPSNATLAVENLLLKNQNEKLRKLLFSEERIEYQLKKIRTLQTLNEEESRNFFKRRIDCAKRALKMECRFISSQVVYRGANSWNSTLWVNSGEKDNEALEERVVAVNSPVLKGPYLIGIVEYVTHSKSRIRLLTDSALVPSVRVVRSGSKNREIFDLIHYLQALLALQKETQEVCTALSQLKKALEGELEGEWKERYLAKGELFGTSSSIWRGRSHILRGVGFNYDFSDEEGAALELRTGRPFDYLSGEEILPIIERGDLLVTTGMDGVFPADIPVAIISSVDSLKEGNVTFDITAKLCAGNLYDLTEVVILPPLSTTKEKDQFLHSQ